MQQKGLCFQYVIAVASWIFCASPAIAQNVITPDASLGAEGSIVQPRNGFDAITGGAARGTGLFHSFSQFDINNPSGAYFLVRPEVQNIFARVTGNQGSVINGAIGTRIDNTELSPSSASLFLLNPNGILFGPNAKLDLGGAFLATTASSIQFGNQEFSAVNPQAAPLLTINVPTGLQFGQTVGPIEVSGATFNPGLEKSLSLVGGDVRISNSTVATISGQLDIGAVGGSETVALQPIKNGWVVSYAGVKNFQDIQLNQSTIAPGANNVGDIAIMPGNLQLQGRQINLTSGSILFYAYQNVNKKDVNPGQVILNASNGITIDSSGVLSLGDGSLSTANISLNANTIIINNIGQVATQRLAGAGGGNITINAADSVTVQANEKGSSFISTFNNSTTNSPGSNIKITTSNFFLLDGASINTSLDKTEGKAGDIEINALNLVRLSGERQLLDSGRQQAFASSIASFAGGNEPVDNGNTGNIQVSTKTLQLIAGGNLSILNTRGGDTGQIRVQANDRIDIQGAATNGFASRITISSADLTRQRVPARPVSSLPGIQITTGSLQLDEGGAITTNNFIDGGNARAIDINATNDLIIRGTQINPSFFSDGIPSFASSQISSAKLGGIGNGGDINVKARNVKILAGGEINANIGSPRNPATPFQGRAGNITIVATESIIVDGEAAQPLSGAQIYPKSEITSDVIEGNAQGGNILLKTGNLQVSNGGQITSDIVGRGNGGTVEIIAADNVLVSGIGKSEERESSSFISASATGSFGDGGNIKITASSLNIEKGAAVATGTTGSGNAGDINLNIQGDITIAGRDSGKNQSHISSASIQLTDSEIQSLNDDAQLLRRPSLEISPSTGDAGDININANSLKITNGAYVSAISNGLGRAGNLNINLRDRALLNNAEIRTASSQTSGGDIDLNASAIVLRNNSNIKTNILAGAGSGGNINLTAPSGIVLLDDSDILAFAKDGKGGNINLQTQALLTRTDKPTAPDADLETLDTNGVVDINAIGAVSGIINLPTLNPLQNNRPELPNTLVDPSNQLSRNCLARNPQTGKFYITGAGGIPPQPGEPSPSTYSTLPVQAQPPQIVEADGIYPVADGKFSIARRCTETTHTENYTAADRN
jgi:filamentous hemagglutinin family protein